MESYFIQIAFLGKEITSAQFKKCVVILLFISNGKFLRKGLSQNFTKYPCSVCSQIHVWYTAVAEVDETMA